MRAREAPVDGGCGWRSKKAKERRKLPRPSMVFGIKFKKQNS